MQSLMTHLGSKAKVRIWTDRNAAEAFSSKRRQVRSRRLVGSGGDQCRKDIMIDKKIEDDRSFDDGSWCEIEKLIGRVGGRTTVSEQLGK